MKQVNLVAALLLFSFSAFAQTVTPDPGPYAPMNQKYEYRWIKTSGGIWNLGKFVQVDSAQFSGVTYVPTAPDNDSSKRVASTAWVKKNITAGSGSGGIDSVRRKLSTDTIVEFYGGALGFRRFAFTAPLPGSFVPYTGATQDVNLGEFGLQTGNVEFDNTPTNLPTDAGSMYYNDSDGTLDLILKGGNVKLQIGQESVVRVVNKTATNINLLEANYQAVRVTGAQGQRLKVDLAQATTDPLSAETIGLVTETINNNQQGFITTNGLVRNINTTGSLQSETWADGDIVYLSPTVAGRITNIKPSAPNHLVIIGYVIHAHATQGSIFVKVDNGYELDELHNVKIVTPTNNQALIFNDTTDVWENKSLVTVSSYGKNATADSTILLLSNGTRYAAKDSVGGGGASGWSLTGNASAVTDFLGTTNNRTMRFRTNNVERMVIDSLGRVGIGTATPTNNFDVVGSARISGQILTLSNSAPYILFTNSGNTGIIGDAASIIGGAAAGFGIRSTGAITFGNGSRSFAELTNNGFVQADESILAASRTRAASAVADIQSTTRGLLIPRMTLTQRNAIASPAAGLQVIVTGETGGEFVSMWNSTAAAWVNQSSNIYTADGNLTGNRTVTMGGNTLLFTGGNVINNERLIVKGGSTTGLTGNGLDLSLQNGNGVIQTYNWTTNSWGNLHLGNNGNTYIGQWPVFDGLKNTNIGGGLEVRNNGGDAFPVLHRTTSTTGFFYTQLRTATVDRFAYGYSSAIPGFTVFNNQTNAHAFTIFNTNSNVTIGSTTDAGFKFDVNGTARVQDKLSVGTPTAASAVLEVTSTTQGVLFPRMTTVQKLAIASPAAGLHVYDNTLNQMSYYNGTIWVNF